MGGGIWGDRRKPLSILGAGVDTHTERTQGQAFPTTTQDRNLSFGHYHSALVLLLLLPQEDSRKCRKPEWKCSRSSIAGICVSIPVLVQ